MTRSRRSSFLLGFLLLSALLLAGPTLGLAAEQAQKSIAFLPFEINAGQDLSYLRNGIRDMLASRLAAEAGVAVVGKDRVDKALPPTGKVDPQALVAVGRTLGADYVVAGSFTSLGGGVSLDASVYEPANPGPPQRFYATAQTEGEVIRAIDQLAWNMAEKLFKVQKPAQFRAAAPAAQGAPPDGGAAFQTAHPERSFIVPAPGAMPGNGGGNQGFFIRPGGTAAGFSKTRNFDLGLQAFEIGDVDGDGGAELIIADETSVFVYRQQGGQLSEMAQVPVVGQNRVHWVSLADTDGNGRPEVYVSAGSAEGPGSMAVEWDGKAFAPLFSGVRWYLRAMELPGEGAVLLGQAPAVDGVLLPGVYRMARKESGLDKGQQLVIPEAVNLFEFNLADVNGDGQAEVIHLTQDDQLRVIRRDGKIIWRSDEDFGGTKRYLGGQPLLGAHQEKSRYDSEGNMDSKKVYVPSRILVTDLNGDKLPDIIVNKNKRQGTKVLKNLRSYTSGELHALSWNGVGMAELWHTRKIDGYIVDYQLQKGGEQDLLHVGLEMGGGFLGEVGGRESTILVFPVDYSAPAQK